MLFLWDGLPRWSGFRAAPFSLPGLANKILNRHTLAAVQHHVLRVFLYLRQVQNADEVIVDHDALRPVLSPALGLIHVDALYKLMQDGGRQRFHLHELPHRLQKLLLTESPVVLPITLALQFLNVLFELLLFLVVPLGHFHKAFIRQLTRYIVLINALKQPVNLFIPGNQLLKVLPSVPALPLIVLGGFLSQQLGKFLGVVF